MTLVSGISYRGMTESRKISLADSSSLALEGMWTAKELANLLRIDTKTIYSYVQRGLIPYVRIQSNVRFSKRQVREWVDRNTFVPNTSAKP